MIIDVHGHVSAPTELWAYKANLLSARGSHGRGGVNVSDDEIRAAANRKENWAKGHLDYLKDHGTDLQLISPRPFQLMQSEKPAKTGSLVCRRMQQHHSSPDEIASRHFHGRLRIAADGRRSDPKRFARARALR